MTEKRFKIMESLIVKDGWFIADNKKKFTFPTIKNGKDICFTLCNALNDLNDNIVFPKKELYQELLIKELQKWLKNK